MIEGVTWEPMDTAPRTGEWLWVRCDNGVVSLMYWCDPPPEELDPEQAFGGWMIDAMVPGYDFDATMTGWRRYDGPSLDFGAPVSP